jgi:hypothetical protein
MFYKGNNQQIQWLTRMGAGCAMGSKGSGQFRVKMHAKLEVAIFQCIRDTKILWFPGGVFDTFVGMS